ncbi:MAG: hypothetical protein NWS01_01135, partial [Burkholderiales bacterium]|nr:hypothetical protein [Burkholderiales bacterium]
SSEENSLNPCLKFGVHFTLLVGTKPKKIFQNITSLSYWIEVLRMLEPELFRMTVCFTGTKTKKEKRDRM